MLLLLAFVVLAVSVVHSEDSACSPERADSCSAGIYYSSLEDNTFLPKSPEQLEEFCKRIDSAQGCLMKEAEGCPEKPKSFLLAVGDGYKVAFQDICNPSMVERRASYLHHAQCLHNNYGKTCMLQYLQQLDLVLLSNSTTKMAIACCNMQYYSLCTRASVTKACGEDAADLQMELANGMAQAPVLRVCGTFIPGSEHCRNSPYIPVEEGAAHPMGTMLSRKLKILLSQEAAHAADHSTYY
ncbi:uncharacterized protein LOC135385546 [Ornithodoros turicata]|uniref:uncharacterized protein LOC135385546 n=1 Tax=Ornithodoros turicata TaxID=34597 RepID=UPI003138CAC3